MASSGYAVSKVGPCGGDGGSANDMDVTGINRIVKIGVRHGWVVDALVVSYLRNGLEETSGHWGGEGGNFEMFTLQPFEYITSVKGHVGSFEGLLVVSSLHFETNLRVLGPFGGQQGVPFELPAFNGKIIGFHGRSGAHLNAIGVYVNKLHDPVDRLMAGFHHFRTEVYDKRPEVFEPLKKGQWPKFMVFACCDSRVPPTMIFDFQPGEAFTVRNIANLVPPFEKTKCRSGEGAAIEYAVHELEVENIVVVGHSKCGGIKGLMTFEYDGNNTTEFVEDWVKIGFPAREKVKAEYGNLSLDEQCAICEKEAVKLSLENLKTYPFVSEALDKGSLKLYGGHYDFVDGTFKILK